MQKKWKIDLFMPPEGKSRYGVLPHFTVKFAEALTRAGVQCRILKAEKNNPKPFLDALLSDSPDCTLSFNGLLPDSQGRFFCDMIKIPHVACLIDSPTQFLTLANSPFTIITCSDRYGCEFLKKLNSRNVLFLPHAIEKDIHVPLETNRKYDVSMLSSCLDYEALEQAWSSKYPSVICEAMKEAIHLSLSSDEISCIQAFLSSMDRLANAENIGTVNYPEIIDQIEIYTKGRERVEMVRAIKDAHVHIFGSGMELWKKYLGKKSNVTFHEPVTFDDAMIIMNQSKIVLNSCAWLKEGTHERILAALSCGALVLTQENIYMREQFKDGHSIAFYPMGKWDVINEKIQDYLEHPHKREEVVARGREVVMRHHTWDQRAATLLKELPSLLSHIKG